MTASYYAKLTSTCKYHIGQFQIASFSYTCAYEYNVWGWPRNYWIRNLTIPQFGVKNYVAMVTACYQGYIYYYMLYSVKYTVRPENLIREIQFLQKAHLQRFRDLIFADGRSRVAPPTISVRLRLLLHARTHPRAEISLESAEKIVKNQQVIDRLYLYLVEIENWHESRIWSRLWSMFTMCTRKFGVPILERSHLV